MKLIFGMIDAKEGSIVCGDNYGSGAFGTASKKNLALILQAKEEYLDRILALQKEIQEKFGPMMEDEPDECDFTDDEEWDMQGIGNPTHNNLYYT